MLFKFIIPTCLCDHVIFGFISACVLWITLKPILVFVCFFVCVFVSFLIPIPPPLARVHTVSQSEAQKKLQPITQVPVLQEQGEYSTGVGGDWTWVWACDQGCDSVLHASSCHCHSPWRLLLIGSWPFCEETEQIRASLAFVLLWGGPQHFSQVWGCTNTQMLC